MSQPYTPRDGFIPIHEFAGLLGFQNSHHYEYDDLIKRLEQYLYQRHLKHQENYTTYFEKLMQEATEIS